MANPAQKTPRKQQSVWLMLGGAMLVSVSHSTSQWSNYRRPAQHIKRLPQMPQHQPIEPPPRHRSGRLPAPCCVVVRQTNLACD